MPNVQCTSNAGGGRKRRKRPLIAATVAPEIAARLLAEATRQRRTLSSIIEEALEKAFAFPRPVNLHAP